MSLNNLVKRLQDIMRNDAGINGDAQRIEQMVWILFLKVYDAKEEIWEFYDEKYTSIIPEELRWRNWAVDHKDGKALTGDALLNFVNVKLFPTLKSIEINENNPRIVHGNSLEKNVRDYKDGDRFDVVLMNPPYGGNEKEGVKQNFPADLRSSETADLFMSVIMYRLKRDGRCAIILPDGFLFGTDNAKVAIKQKLLSEFNLHTVIRMPHSVFAPYTSITTNILFFDRTGPTKETWFYRLDMPEGYKNFSKTKPMKLEHFAPAMEWWDNRQEIIEGGFDKAKKYTVQEIVSRSYNIDLCGYPHEEEEILPPKELIQQYQEKRASLNADIDRILAQITDILGISLIEEDRK